MPNPTISIVTTVYDAKDYIPRTVRSILAQSFTDFELLLVEDGSPNGCGELCDELAKTDGRIRVVHKPNGGPASAANAGLDAAQGRAGISILQNAGKQLPPLGKRHAAGAAGQQPILI